MIFSATIALVTVGVLVALFIAFAFATGMLMARAARELDEDRG